MTDASALRRPTPGAVRRVVQDPARLAAVRATGLLDAPTEAAFERLAALAATLLHVPLATVTLVDGERQFYTACVGLPEPLATARETPLDVSFCRLTVADAALGALPTDGVLAIPDTREDPRTRDMASVTHYGVHAYAGVPLVVDGQPVGTLCVMDLRPRAWGPAERDVLVELGRSVTTEIELRAANRRLSVAHAESAALLRTLRGQHAELALAHEQLQEQQAELEVSSLRMQEQQAELEAQADALHDANVDLEAALAAAQAARAEAAARAAEAERANQAKSEFLATMSHELRTPLNAIGGYTQLVDMGLHGPVTAQQHDALGRVQKAQGHLLGLINDVLRYAKLESGRTEYDAADVAAGDVVTDVLPLVEPQAAARGLALAVSLPEDRGGPPAVLWADRDKAAQVLLNLLANAVKFTEPGGRVLVRVEAAGPVVHLRVTDTGRGIAADKLDTVFEAFVQVGKRHPGDAPGTGLGLAISRDLARGMGGTLTVESTPGVGSTFTVTLPSAAAPR